MPREFTDSNGNRYLEFLPGEFVPDSVPGEIARFTIPPTATPEHGTSEPVGMLEDEGLDTPEQLEADRDLTREMNARMAESMAGFRSSQTSFDRKLLAGIGIVTVTWLAMEHFDLLGPWIQ